jgi:hypothetical protein
VIGGQAGAIKALAACTEAAVALAFRFSPFPLMCPQPLQGRSQAAQPALPCPKFSLWLATDDLYTFSSISSASFFTVAAPPSQSRHTADGRLRLHQLTMS